MLELIVLKKNFIKNIQEFSFYIIDFNILFFMDSVFSRKIYKNIFFLKKLNKYYFYYFIKYWFSLTFKGKSYRVRKFKNYNKFTFNMAYSHWSKLIFSSVFFIFRNKRRNFPGNVLYYHLWKFFYLKLKEVRKLNKYTKRGLRFKKQGIVRRFGKISQLISMFDRQ